MPAFQNKFWCFTLFEKPAYDVKSFRYLVVGKEKCPTTGKVHWQGYCETDKRTTMGGVKKLMRDNKCHLEIRKGTGEEAAKYCKKDGEFEEHGEMVTQGQRKDLAEICKDITTKKRTLGEIMEGDDAETFVRYRGGLQAIANYTDCMAAKRWREIEQHVYVGIEMRSVMKEVVTDYPDACIATMTHKMSWDFYQGEDTLIVIGNPSCNSWLTQEWRLCLDVKFGMKYAAWTKIIWIAADPATAGDYEGWWTNDKYVMKKVTEVVTEVGG